MKKALWKLLKSLVLFVLSLFLLSAAVFYVSRLAPGDPLVSYYGDRVEKMSPEQRAWAEARLGLDQPISTQYVRWLGQALKGDFGISYKYKMDVLEALKAAGYNTTRIRREGLFSQSTLQKLRTGGQLSWSNIEMICKLLDCQPGDLLEYTPE